MSRRYEEFKSFYERYAPIFQIVTGAILIAVSVVLVIVAVQVAAVRAHERDNSKTACERTLLFAPELGAFFEREHALSDEHLRLYKSLLPTHC